MQKRKGEHRRRKKTGRSRQRKIKEEAAKEKETPETMEDQMKNKGS